MVWSDPVGIVKVGFILQKEVVHVRNGTFATCFLGSFICCFRGVNGV